MKRELIILIMAGMFIACGVAAFWIPDANDNLEPLDNTWGLRIPSLASCDSVDTNPSGVFACGTDATGATANDWYFTGDDVMYASTTRSKIGIGTTTPVSKTHIWGDLRVGTTTVPSFYVDTGTGYVGIGTASPTELFDIAGNFTIGSAGNATSVELYVSGVFVSGSSTDWTLTADWKAAAIDGSDRLEMAYGGTEADLSAITTGGLIAGNGAGSVGVLNVGTDLYPLVASSTASAGVAWQKLDATGVEDIYLLNTGDTAAGDYTFDTTTLKIDSSNDRVGIGTSTPEYTLDVVGQVKITATTTIRDLLIVDDRSSSGTTTLQIGSTTTQNVGCLKIFDTDRLGWTFCTTLDGAMNCGTTACE